jgi:Protein of unknown function (DUF2281)
MQVTIELLNDHALNLLRDLERMSIIRFTKKTDTTSATIENEKTVKKQRNFGVMKGLVLHMAKDFNAPLEDFNEYM